MRDGLARLNELAWEEVGRRPTKDGYFVQQRLEQSLGLLAQIRILGLNASAPPGLLFSSLHPKIVESCQPLFAPGSYDSAILTAFRTVEEEVRTRAGAPATDIGVALMSNALNSKGPRLKFSDINAEQEGYHALFRGAIASFNKPRKP